MDWKRARKRMHCDCSIHDVVSSVLEYFIITPIFATAYLAVTVPWMLFVIKLDGEQFTDFIWQSVLVDLIVAYPVTKLIMKLKPKIEKITSLRH